ncbi:hypothetical protein PPERSA_07011 [Pseudocohnilembus persalinus]|uniref:Uncharacterized protein n=1 Tax=Pseudocohnilembus persalinus TaxID=266149 RepID=A0A0V0Q7R8_PSEPJ|nr:hypothetical protein PPERSA_07011 [Pseudocohnilembus persalinus]|eukprot:KRW98202.1 hypothetical protein PPERSA_07011 [Pseudocohnilembus persalinus]
MTYFLTYQKTILINFQTYLKKKGGFRGEKFQNSGKQILLWETVGRNGLRVLVKVDGHLDSEKYQNIKIFQKRVYSTISYLINVLNINSVRQNATPRNPH